MTMRIRLFICCVVFLFGLSQSKAQAIWEDSRSMVYPFLTRLADKGLIDLDDIVLPITQTKIVAALQSLQSKQEQLNKLEKAEWKFFLKEYALPYEIKDTLQQKLKFFQKDLNGRWRGATVGNQQFYIQVDPITGIKSTRNGQGSSHEYGSGFHTKIFMGRHLAFQMYYRDISRGGAGFNINQNYTEETAGLKLDTNQASSINFTDLRTALAYQGKNFIITIGNDHMNWGYGQRGKIVLGNKIPTFPFIRLDYSPIKWFSFNYAHTWLQSNIIDSNKIYNLGNTIYGGRREQYIPSYMVTHTANLFPIKGLVFSLGESIVYSDRFFVPYLFPMMFFKVIDVTNRMGYNNLASSNTQLFTQLSLRNVIPESQLYGTLFVDELRFKTMFSRSKSRNQLGITLGFQKHDVVENLSIGTEYTRVNPFVYSNFIPAQQYKHAGYEMGDWMGNNFDRFTVYTNYKPIPRLLLNLRFERIRKGGEGSLLQQYFAEPQPPFLFNSQWNSIEFSLNGRFEIVHRLYLSAILSVKSREDLMNNTRNTLQQSQIGLNFGW
jgi:hypothetical protein